MLNLDIGLYELVTAIFISTAGALVQSSVGFGFALVTVPLLTLMDPVFVPGPTLLANLLLAILMSIRERAAIEQGQLSVAAWGLAVGTVIGALALTLMPREHLSGLFGLVILASVALSVIGHHVSITPRNLLVVGITSGVMGTMAGIHGPPIALLYQRAPGRTVRATLAVFFAFAYAISICALFITHLFGMRELLLCAILVPGVIIGYLLSWKIQEKFDGQYLWRAILAVAGLSGLALVGKELSALFFL